MIILTFLCSFIIPSTIAQVTHGQNRTFYETFDLPLLDPTAWNTGYPWGSYYNHRANTIPRQVKITRDGFLNITATRERSIALHLLTEFGSMEVDFTSGALNTNGKFCIKNGFINIALRVPEGEITWPSVFFVPEDQGTVPSLTVMEVFNGRSSYSYGFKYTNNQGEAQEETFVASNKKTTDAMHRYGLDWGYDQITWFYDDKWVNTITKSDQLRQVDNMCLVIGLGVGGKSNDSPINPENFPATMSIDAIEIWQPKYDGFYRFQNLQTGLFIDVDSASHSSGARILQWYDNGGDWQKWHVQYAGHGQFRLLAGHSRQGLDAADWNTSNGTNLIQWDYHSGNNQLWKIQIVDENSPDIVQLVNVLTLTNWQPGKIVSVPTGDTSAGVQLQLWSNMNSDLQKWRMIPA